MRKMAQNKDLIWAVVLAAGESKRMGAPKLLLPFGKKSIIEAVIDNVLKSPLRRVLIVLGADWEKIQERIKNYPVRITVNPHFQKGMLSSVQWGIQKLPRKTKAALVILGDQPQILPGTISLVLEGYQSGTKGIVLPVYRKSGGHPLLLDMKYRDEIKTLNPKIGLRHLLSLHPDDILKVKMKHSHVLRDIDDEADYKRELRKSLV